MAAPITTGTLVPNDEAALSETLREAAARGQGVVSEGGGSKRHHGAVSAATERARRLSLRHFTAVTRHDPADLVVSVQAGARLADLQRCLAEHGQWLPVDPPYANATIGGILATGGAGPRRLGYGTLKDHLIGLRVAGRDGVITTSGGRVVKNVSGYDLHRLHIGAFGTLGVLVEAHFKLTPRPAVTAVLALGCASFAEAHRRLLAVAGLRPVALEAYDAGHAAGLRAALPGLPEGAGLALVGIEGSAATLARHLADLDRTGSEALLEGEAAVRLWLAVRDLPAAHTERLVVRVGARPHELPGLLDELGLAALGAEAQACQVGTGLARVRFGPVELAKVAPALQERAARAEARGGYLVVEAAPLGVAGREALPFGAGSAPSRALARRVAEAWDPKGLLNPGRLPA